MAGPYILAPVANLHGSGVGKAPKKDGGWRIIYHLSARLGRSINVFIDADQHTAQLTMLFRLFIN